MKKINYFFQFSLLIALIFSPVIENISFGQNTEGKQVRVKIIKKENGTNRVIDTSFTITETDDVSDILRELNIELETELGEVKDGEKMEIIIKRTKDDMDLREFEMEIGQRGRWKDHAFMKKSDHGFLGVHIIGNQSIEESTEDESEKIIEQGAKIINVIDGSGASKAGLLDGDIIKAINGSEVKGYKDLVEILKTTRPGDVVVVTYTREGTAYTTNVTLGEQSLPGIKMLHHDAPGMFKWHGDEGNHFFGMESREGSDKPMIGVKLGPPNENLQGVKIEGIIDETAASEMGLQKGDIITGINGMKVGSIVDLFENIKDAEIGQKITIDFTRDGNIMQGTGTLTGRKNIKNGNQHFRFEGKEQMLREMEEALEDFEFEFDFDEEELHKMIKEKIEKSGHKDLDWDIYLDDEKTDGEIVIHKIAILIEMDDLSSEEASKLKVSPENTLKIESLRFSPNPGDGRFNLSFELPESGKTTIRIFDSNGNEVYKEKLNKFTGEYQGQIDITNEPKGLYFLVIEQNGNSLSKKIIVQ